MIVRGSLSIRLRSFATKLLKSASIFACVWSGVVVAEGNDESYTLFESGQVRPLALSGDKQTLFALNTPDNRLEIYDVTNGGLVRKSSILVGMEPVALAVRNDKEVWVVNHVSDSVSVINVEGGNPRILRTLLVGDEPSDIVFAGESNSHAYITTAHRGQNVPYDPQLTVPGVGRADVWVFDGNNQGNTLGGSPVNIINLFTDTPRALAVSPDGKTVYAAGFKTGNKTTTVFEELVAVNGGLPEPITNFEGNAQPVTGLIVKHDGDHWVDEAGRVWDDQIMFSLPDKDVFVIDAMSNPPALINTGSNSFQGVGTVLFNMAVNPASGKVYVANLESFNHKRFGGKGDFAQQTIRGHFSESRISVLDESGVDSFNLNSHIDYSQCCDSVPNEEGELSLAFPGDMVFSKDGSTLYVTAFGSRKIGVIDTEELEGDSFVPSENSQIELSGGGPSGVVIDEDSNRLYVLTRFDNSISVVDLEKKEEISKVEMYNPEPEHIVKGRKFLYDARLTSSHGDSACHSCHVFGDMDGLAWDLGDPDATQAKNPGPFILLPEQFGSPVDVNHAPMKGPMVTQSLRGMANHGPMHWRGDKTGGLDAPTFQPDSGAYDEDAAFKKFNVAFVDLHGRDEQLTDEQMQAFTDYILDVTYPPNPIRRLDNSLTEDEQVGQDFYFNTVSDTFFACNGCHTLDPNGNSEFGVKKPGFFGTDGRSSFSFFSQMTKVPQLRNMYQKVGMFGMPATPFLFPTVLGNAGFMGDQIKGFGYIHDGSVDTMFRFHQILHFTQRPPEVFFPGDPGNAGGFTNDEAGIKLRRQVEAFLLAYPSNLRPIVGQQITVNKDNIASSMARVDLFKARADAGDCDLVASAGGRKTYLYVGNGLFSTNVEGNSKLEIDQMLSNISKGVVAGSGGGNSQGVTFTCTPTGSGARIAFDKN